MREIQALELSKRFYKKFLETIILKPYDGEDEWEISDELLKTFNVRLREYTDGTCDLGFNMAFAMNKFSDCPIVCTFPSSEKEWEDLFVALEKLRQDSYVENSHDFGSRYNNLKVSKE